jgi:hypothetical protein
MIFKRLDINSIGQWETVDITEPELLDDEEMMEEEELPVAKKEKGKGRA